MDALRGFGAGRRRDARAAGAVPGDRRGARGGAVSRPGSCTPRTAAHDPVPADPPRPGTSGRGRVRGRPGRRARRAVRRATCAVVALGRDDGEAAPGRRTGLLRRPVRARAGRDDRDRAGRLRRRVPEAARGEGRRPDRGPAPSGRRDGHDGPDPRGLRGRVRGSGRRGRADRRPGRRTHPGRGARRARRHDRAPDRDRDRPSASRASTSATEGDPDEPKAHRPGHRRHRRRRGRGRRDRAHGAELATPDPTPRPTNTCPSSRPRIWDRCGRSTGPSSPFAPPATLQADDRVRPRVQPRHDDLALPMDRPVRPVPVRVVRLPARTVGSARVGWRRPARRSRSATTSRPSSARSGTGPCSWSRHSMGAMSMLAMAETQPELFGDPVAGVVFVGSAAQRSGPGRVRLGDRAAPSAARVAPAGRRTREPAPAVRAVEPRRRGAADRPRDAVRARRLAPPRPVRGRARRASAPSEVWTDGLAGLLELDLRHAVQHIAVPAMVLVGEQDRMTPPLVLRRARRRAPRGPPRGDPGRRALPDDGGARGVQPAAGLVRRRGAPTAPESAKERMSGREVPGVITRVAGIRIGSRDRTSTGITGAPWSCAPPGTTGSVDVKGVRRGRERPMRSGRGPPVNEIHAVLLTGGSAFGLAAAGGVARWLEEREVGFDAGVARVPIVPAAVCSISRSASPTARPDEAAGYAACEAAADGDVEEGSVGAGTGATVAKQPDPAAWAGRAGSGARRSRRARSWSRRSPPSTRSGPWSERTAAADRREPQPRRRAPVAGRAPKHDARGRRHERDAVEGAAQLLAQAGNEGSRSP